MFRPRFILYASLVLFFCAKSYAVDGSVTLTPEAIKAGQIELASLGASKQATTLAAFGQILDPAALAALVAQLTDAKAQVGAAEAKLSLAKANADRAARLFHAQHNVSEADLEAANAAAQVAAADAGAAKAKLTSLEASIRANWGPALAPSIMSGDDLLSDFQAGKACLVQAVLPLGQALPTPPETATASLPDRGTMSLKLIGPSPRVAPGMTGQALFYMSSSTGVCPPIGMPVQVQLPKGPEQSGVLVPASAVVWRGAQPIIYLTSGENRFQPIPISTADHEANGYFVLVSSDVPLKAGASVVVKGAALLLSEAQSPADKKSTTSGGDDDD
ncbi:MAG TPA: hypothetical protein VHO91_09680 [Rhodopila sp.]|nr:hypothetical protein [Rhodopila sp.]